jgi:uncharacterized protein (DUF1800 family)
MAADTEDQPPLDGVKNPTQAWAPYKPDERRSWTLALAGHLYRRAAFGADWNQLKQALADGPQKTVDQLLRPTADSGDFNRQYDRHEAAVAGGDSAQPLQAWWLRRMIHTPHPLLEKMTLFWHSHFGVSRAAVGDGPLIQRHVQLLRSHALGSFQAMLEAVARDPAVLICLGAKANRKAMPDENLARTLLKTFAVGPGHHTAEDIREAARAFSGTFVFSGKVRHIAREHDEGVKRILGQSGNFAADDVVRIALAQPATPQLLVGKLYRWLIAETERPDERLIAPLAESFARDYDVLKLVETMLRSNLFFSAAAYRRRIKCPVEFALGIIKALEGVVSTTRLAGHLTQLGQSLYRPPTVEGWPGGRHWINRATLVRRHNLAAALLHGNEPYGDKLRPWDVARKHGSNTPAAAGRFLLDLFLQGDLQPQAKEALLETLAEPAGGPAVAMRRFAYTITTLDEFQLA